MNSIKIDNVDIELVNYYTLLAITLDNKLKYSIHIDLLCIKLSKIIYLFTKLSFKDSQHKKLYFII